MSVTYAIDRGFDLKAVSERARHAQVSTTADIYAHVLPQKDQAIAANLNEIIVQSQNTNEEKPIKKLNEDTFCEDCYPSCFSSKHKSL